MSFECIRQVTTRSDLSPEEQTMHIFLVSFVFNCYLSTVFSYAMNRFLSIFKLDRAQNKKIFH